jgi:hypothetical protein
MIGIDSGPDLQTKTANRRFGWLITSRFLKKLALQPIFVGIENSSKQWMFGRDWE